MLVLSLRKARNIMQRGEAEEKSKGNSYIAVPDSELTQALCTALRLTGTVVVCDRGKKISELVASTRNNHNN